MGHIGPARECVFTSLIVVSTRDACASSFTCSIGCPYKDYKWEVPDLRNIDMKIYVAKYAKTLKIDNLKNFNKFDQPLIKCDDLDKSL